MNDTRHTESTSGDFERQAREHCDDILRLVRSSYAPSKAIEGLVILGFMRGAGWALNVKTPRIPEAVSDDEVSK
jgi:hypothetical protein